MNHSGVTRAADSPIDESLDYDAPGIEMVMTPEELEREVMYGAVSTLIVCQDG
jgi:hypothetical protein